MSKKRIYELAKDYKLSSNAMLAILRELKFEPKSHMSVATDEMVTAIQKRRDSINVHCHTGQWEKRGSAAVSVPVWNRIVKVPITKMGA